MRGGAVGRGGGGGVQMRTMREPLYMLEHQFIDAPGASKNNTVENRGKLK